MNNINNQLQSVENIETNANAESVRNDEKIIETSSQNDRLQHSLDDDLPMEIKNITSSLNKIGNNIEIKVEHLSNESTSNEITEQKNTEDEEIEGNIKIKTSNPLEPIKKKITNNIVINTSKNQIFSSTQRTDFPLKSEENDNSKVDTLGIKLSPPMSDQTRVTPSIITLSSATAVKPIPTVSNLQPKSNITETNYIKNVLNKGIKITSSEKSSKMVVVSHNGMNFITKIPNKPMQTSNIECNESNEGKKKVLVNQLNSSKKVSKFVTRMQKLPDGKYKMLAPAGDLPPGLEKLFNSNSHFIKQKGNLYSTNNERKVSYFIQSSSDNSSFKVTNNVRNDSQVSPEETNCKKILLINPNNKEKNCNLELQESFEGTKSKEISSNSVIEKAKNIKKELPEYNSLEISSLSSNNEEIKHSENKLQKSSEETEFKEMSSVSSDAKVKNIENELQECNSSEISSLSINNEETNCSKTELQNPLKETEYMKTSSINCNSKETNDCKIMQQLSPQETKNMKKSPVNLYSNKMNYVQKKFQLTSNQMDCIGTSLVDHDLLIRIKKEPPALPDELNDDFETSSFNLIDEEANNILKESQETNITEISSISSSMDETVNTENEKKSQVLFQEMPNMNTSSITSMTDKSKNIHEESQILSEESNSMETSSIYSINEETNYSECDLKESSEKPSCMEKSSIYSINEETNYNECDLKESSEKPSCMETSSIYSTSEEINHSECDLKESSEKPSCMETSSIYSTNEEINHSECDLKESSEKPSCMETSSIYSINEETNYSECDLKESSEKPSCMETSSIYSTNEEINHSECDLKESSEKPSCIETSSIYSINEETNYNECDLKESSEKPSCMETSSIYSINEETNYSECDLKESSEKPSCVETSSIYSINEETNYRECDLKESSEKPSCMETSSTNSISEESNIVQKESQVLSLETNNIETSSVNSLVEKTLHIQTKSPIISEQIKCKGTNLVDPDVLLRMKKEKPEYENNSSNIIFKAPDTSSFQRHKFIVSRSTANKKYAMKNIVNLNNTNIVNINNTNIINLNNTNFINVKNTNIVNVNNKIRISPIQKRPLFTSPRPLVRLLPKTQQPTIQTNKQPLIISKYDPKSNPKTQLTIQTNNQPLIISKYDPKSIPKTQPTIQTNNQPLIISKYDPKSIPKTQPTIQTNNQPLIFSKYDPKSIPKTQPTIQTNNQPLIFSKYDPKNNPKTQPTFQTNNQPFIISKYDPKSNPNIKLNPSFNNNGKKVLVKILKADIENAGRIVPVGEMNKIFPRVIHASKIIKIEENPNKNKITPSEVIQKDNKMKVTVKEEDRKLIACQNKYCTSLTHNIIHPELIDNLYCSLACKMLDSKQFSAVQKPEENMQPKEDSPKKPVIDRKKLLEKLKSRINKRKQSMPPYYPEKIPRNVHFVNPKEIEVPYIKPSSNIQPIDQQSSLKSPHQIIPKSVENVGRFRKPTQPKIEDLEEVNELSLKYIREKEFKPAPRKLFDNASPWDRNCFQVGHKMEGIDPTHEALFCVLTVVEVIGYRLKLHFDGYPGDYDFWVNADNPDLFYTNWCLENNRTLQAPRGYKKKFDWYDYLHENSGAIPAPKINFISTKNLAGVSKHLFHVGTKLEALDKTTRTLSKQLICVATVADVLGKRIRIHFDGWSNDFDYWADITSTNLHPVGWCEKNGRNLCPPNDYNGKKPFSWTEYLKETNSKPVPEEAFIRCPLREFTVDMAMEVVDLVNPSFIRIARVVDVKGNELKILYDGFDSKYAYWIDDDSTDIHPIGWCIETNHPIEIPSGDLLYCKIAGCNGKGNANNSLKPYHFSLKDCPYDFERWEKMVSGIPTLPDRLSLKDVPIKMQFRKHDKKKETSKRNSILSKNLCDPRKKIIQKQKEKIIQLQKQGLITLEKTRIIQNKSNKIKKIKKINQINKINKINQTNKINKINKINQTNKINKINKTEIKKNKNVIKRRPLKIKSNASIKKRLNRIVRILDDVEYQAERPVEKDLYRAHFEIKGRVWPEYPKLQLPKFPNPDAMKWSKEEVGSYVDKLVSLNSTYRSPDEEVKYAGRFIKKQIDGKKFLDLSQEYISKSLKIPLGSTLKIFNGIKILRREYPELVFKDEKYNFF